MTRQQIEKANKEIAKNESPSVYKLKSQDNRGKHSRARQAKDFIRHNSQGE